MSEELDWFVGIDWASAAHQVCVMDAKGKVAGEKSFGHTGEGLAELCAFALAKTGAMPEAIGIVIEVNHGPIVETLLERGFAVHAINPKQLDRFRDRFTAAGAKDGRRDAKVLASALRTDPHCLHRLGMADPAIVELREWSRIADELQQERVCLCNRLREQLWRYFPQLLELTDDLSEGFFLELWAMAPSPHKAARLRKDRIERLLKAHRIRRIDAEGVLALVRRKPLSVSPAAAAAAQAHIGLIVPRLKLVAEQLQKAHRQLDALTPKTGGGLGAAPKEGPDDVTLLDSLPGLGRIGLATLICEAADALRDRDYQRLRSLCGVAPVTKRSGKACFVVMRRACHGRLRCAVFHWASSAMQHDEASKRRYKALRERGHGHARALRTIADRLLAVACAMLKTRTFFNTAAGVPAAAGT